MMKESSPSDPAAAEAIPGIPVNSLLPILRRIGIEYAFRLQAWGLPVHTMQTLLRIYLNPEGAEPARLAEDEINRIPRQTMTFILDALEKQKLVQRTEHPHDRRRKLIRITPAGEKVAKGAYHDLLEFEQKGHAVIPPDLAPVIRDYILKYTNALIAENDKIRHKPQVTL